MTHDHVLSIEAFQAVKRRAARERSMVWAGLFRAGVDAIKSLFSRAPAVAAAA